MPEKEEPQNIFKALNDYMEVAYTAKFLRNKYIPLWEEHVLLKVSGEDKEVAYIGLEVLKSITTSLENGLEDAHTTSTFDQIIARNFEDKGE